MKRNLGTFVLLILLVLTVVALETVKTPTGVSASIYPTTHRNF